jgi:hypothetical protein
MSNLKDIAAQGSGNVITDTALKPKVSTEVEALLLRDQQLSIQLKEMELKEKTANLQDLQERLDERELRRENKRQRSLTNGATLRANKSAEVAVQNRCNHKKGGNGAAGVVGGRGDSPDFAVIKHTFANGDMWVRCQRCGKTWKPPVKRAFINADGVFNEESYRIAYERYELAKEFQTKNSPSSAYVFRYSDNGEFYREVTENATLGKY